MYHCFLACTCYLLVALKLVFVSGILISCKEPSLGHKEHCFLPQCAGRTVGYECEFAPDQFSKSTTPKTVRFRISDDVLFVQDLWHSLTSGFDILTLFVPEH